MAHLIKEKNGKYFIKEVEVLESPAKARGLLHHLRWEILKLLAEKPRHASEIARILGEHEQKIYYHMRQLENLGLIKLERKLELQGALAKIYAPTKYAFALELPYGEERLMDTPVRKKEDVVYRFFFPHILGGKA
jgi:DNA-binding transcriptional ArsR family regulator